MGVLSCSSMHGEQLCRRARVHPCSLLRIRLSWLLRLHLSHCDFDSHPLFLVSLFLSLYINIYILSTDIHETYAFE